MDIVDSTFGISFFLNNIPINSFELQKALLNNKTNIKIKRYEKTNNSLEIEKHMPYWPTVFNNVLVKHNPEKTFLQKIFPIKFLVDMQLLYKQIKSKTPDHYKLHNKVFFLLIIILPIIFSFFVSIATFIFIKILCIRQADKKNILKSYYLIKNSYITTKF